MPEESKRFHFDTVLSIMTGKIHSPKARKEMLALWEHLFSKMEFPKGPQAQYSDIKDIGALAMCGFAHNNQELYRKYVEAILVTTRTTSLLQIVEPNHAQRVLGEKLREAGVLGADDTIGIAPFTPSTAKLLSEKFNTIISEAIFLRQQQAKLADLQVFYFKQDPLDETVIFEEEPTPTPPTTAAGTISKDYPRNVTVEEGAALPQFEGLLFAQQIQACILSICKSQKVPVTPASFKKTNIGGRFYSGIEVPELQRGTVRSALLKAGFTEEECKPAKSTVAGRAMLAIDMEALDKRALLLIEPLQKHCAALIAGRGPA